MIRAPIMRTGHLWCLIVISLISGCVADSASQKRGTAVVVYQQQHHFQLSPHSLDAPFDEARLSALLTQFDLQVSQFELTYAPKLAAHAKQVSNYLLSHGTAPQQIGHKPVASSAALHMVVTHWSREIEVCPAPSLNQAQPIKGCHVEANRMAQMVFIEHYVSEE